MLPDSPRRRWRGIVSIGAAGLLLLAAAARPSRPAPAPAPAPKRPGPSLGVIVAVDGLSWSRFALYRPWYVAGLKRLLDEGHVETACRYRHLNTETGPGHASLGTGEPPRRHGIVANSWYEADGAGHPQSVYCTSQPAAGGADRVTGPGNLRVPTLGDRLLERHPTARVVSLAGKDRSAIFLAGRDRRHTAYWYDSKTGEMKTSPVYEPPAVARTLVGDFNARAAGESLPKRFGLRWSALPPPRDDSVRPTAAPASGFMDYQVPWIGLGWDHGLDWGGRRYASSFYGTPFLDTLIADLAVAFLESEELALGRGAAPDLLALSFSAHDVVAHNYGAESEEALDVLRRLDLELGRVLDVLERRVGKERVVLGFSSDHGFSSIPEAAPSDAATRGGRLMDGARTVTDFVERLDRYVGEELCLADGARVLLGNHGWNLAYNRAAFPLRTVEGACGPAGREVRGADVDRVLPAALRRLYREEIDGVWLVSERARWPERDPVGEYVRNDFDEARSGDAILVPRPGVIVHWDPARGSTHGSHHDYDTHVPLVFWGGPFAARESAEPSAPYDLAPTLAGPLGLEMKGVAGRSRR